MFDFDRKFTFGEFVEALKNLPEGERVDLLLKTGVARLRDLLLYGDYQPYKRYYLDAYCYREDAHRSLKEILDLLSVEALIEIFKKLGVHWIFNVIKYDNLHFTIPEAAQEQFFGFLKEHILSTLTTGVEVLDFLRRMKPFLAYSWGENYVKEILNLEKVRSLIDGETLARAYKGRFYEENKLFFKLLPPNYVTTQIINTFNQLRSALDQLKEFCSYGFITEVIGIEHTKKLVQTAYQLFTVVNNLLPEQHEKFLAALGEEHLRGMVQTQQSLNEALRYKAMLPTYIVKNLLNETQVKEIIPNIQALGKVLENVTVETAKAFISGLQSYAHVDQTLIANASLIEFARFLQGFSKYSDPVEKSINAWKAISVQLDLTPLRKRALETDQGKLYKALREGCILWFHEMSSVLSEMLGVPSEVLLEVLPPPNDTPSPRKNEDRGPRSLSSSSSLFLSAKPLIAEPQKPSASAAAMSGSGAESASVSKTDNVGDPYDEIMDRILGKEGRRKNKP